MGWKGTLRAVQAAQRRAEREAKRHQRELEKRRKEIEKLEAMEQAAYEVELYENRLDLLISVHKDCGEFWNWSEIQKTKPPIQPVKRHTNTEIAQKKLDNYKPGIIDRTFKRVESKKDKIKQEVDVAKAKDEEEFQEEIKSYESEKEDWKSLKELAEKILSGDLEAYANAVKEINPFSEISELGSSLEFRFVNDLIAEVTLSINSEEVIPKEIKSLSKSGKMLTKNMPKGKFYELYQDYVCSCVLRVAREIFALLPIESVAIHAMGELLNTKTGHLENQPVLSVIIPKKTLDKLNLDMIDPSDSMSNFVHNMSFKKTTGFANVEKVDLSNIKGEKS